MVIAPVPGRVRQCIARIASLAGGPVQAKAAALSRSGNARSARRAWLGRGARRILRPAIGVLRAGGQREVWHAVVPARAVRCSARGLLPQRRRMEPAALGDPGGGPQGGSAQGSAVAVGSRVRGRSQHERARRAAARQIEADPADVALISSVAYGVATAAKSLAVPVGSRVLVLQDDHSSPVLEWMTRAEAGRFLVETVQRPSNGDWTAALLAAIERPGAAPVAVASFSSVHWSDGGAVDLARVAPALRARGAAMLVDATHSAGVLPLDVRARRSRLRPVPDLQVAARTLRPRVPLRRQAPPGRHPPRADEPRPPHGQGRAGRLLHRHPLSRRRTPLRHGRARPLHLARDGRNRHGDGGRVGLQGDRRAAGDADRAPGRRHRGPMSRCCRRICARRTCWA